MNMATLKHGLRSAALTIISSLVSYCVMADSTVTASREYVNRKFEAATNYVDAATNDVLVAAEGYTDEKISEISAPDFSTNNVELVETIEATASSPGNYAAVSNAAVNAAITNALQDTAIAGKMPSTATGADIAVSGTDATKISTALAGKATKSDATLTERGFTEWVCNPSTVLVNGKTYPAVVYRFEPVAGSAYWAVGTYSGWSPYAIQPYDETATSLTFSLEAIFEPRTVTATRTVLQGYQLGSQTDKPLASEAEAEALRTGKADKSDVDQLLFAQYYPDGNVKSAAEFTPGIEYDDPDTTNRTITVKPFCNEGGSDNPSLVDRVVIPPYVDAQGNGYISDDGTRFKVVGVSSCGLGDYNTNLTAIVAPTTVARIEYNAFNGCTSLTSISLPSVTNIGNGAFTDCYSLASVSLPSVTNIGNGAFQDCYSLASVSLPAATSIGGHAFASCTALTFVSLPAATNIWEAAFYGCDSLASVSLPASTTIGGDAFSSCTALTFVSLPAATNIDIGAFYGCDSLASVSLPAATTIGNSAFESCTALTSVSLPSATTIGYHAFDGCDSLDSVDLGDTHRSSVPTLGVLVFVGVPTSCKIIIPDTQYDDWVAAPGWSDLVTAGYKFILHSEWEYARRYEVDGKLDSMVAIAWSDIKANSDGSLLVPGQQYRITNYVATTSGDMESRSANHPFDIIVTADDERTLNEHARAIMHETVLDFAEGTQYTVGDFCKYNGTVYKCTTAHQGEWNAGDFIEESPYFYNCDLAAWDVWYCLDNDTNRFAWADATNGNGVVYRLVDEFQNDAPYDFKGIQFQRWAVTNVTSTKLGDTSIDSLNSSFVKSENGGLYYARQSTNISVNGTTLVVDGSDSVWYYTFGGADDLSLAGVVKTVLVNEIAEYIIDNKRKLNNIVFLGYYCYNNTFYYDCESNTIGLGCYNNVFGPLSSRNILGPGFCQNTLGYSCYSNIFGPSAEGNIFGNECDNNIAGEWLIYNTFGYLLNNNTFGDWFCDNTLGKECEGNAFGDDFSFNTFGNSCCNNTFSSNCYYNTFGDGCYDNTFGATFYYNTFGVGCHNNTFGLECDYNTLGTECYDNTFGAYCHNNTLGFECNHNTFGSECYDNTFGVHCYDNTFSSNCYYNTFVSDCFSNTFGFECDYNTLGTECNHNTFGDGCLYNTLDTSCFHNTFGERCYGNTFGFGCYYNMLGSDCSYATFDSCCNYNTFGEGCNYNTFGIECSFNIIGSVCVYNMFGSECIYNTLGSDCYYNKFGEGCSYNTFGANCYVGEWDGFRQLGVGTSVKYGNILRAVLKRYCVFSDSQTYLVGDTTYMLGKYWECTTEHSGAWDESHFTEIQPVGGILSAEEYVPQSYYSYVELEDGVSFVALDCTTNRENGVCYKNVTVSKGIGGTDSAPKHIEDANFNQSFKTTYQPAGSLVIDVQ